MESVINIARPAIGSQAAVGRHDQRARQSAMTGISNNDSVQRKLKIGETAQNAYMAAVGGKPVQQQKLLVIECEADPPGRYTSALDDFELLFAGDKDTTLAKLIEHQPQSPRIKASFVAINCAAIPADLHESVLFGYEKGAFRDTCSRMSGKYALSEPVQTYGGCIRR